MRCLSLIGPANVSQLLNPELPQSTQHPIHLKRAQNASSNIGQALSFPVSFLQASITKDTVGANMSSPRRPQTHYVPPSPRCRPLRRLPHPLPVELWPFRYPAASAVAAGGVASSLEVRKECSATTTKDSGAIWIMSSNFSTTVSQRAGKPKWMDCNANPSLTNVILMFYLALAYNYSW